MEKVVLMRAIRWEQGLAIGRFYFDENMLRVFSYKIVNPSTIKCQRGFVDGECRFFTSIEKAKQEYGDDVIIVVA